MTDAADRIEALTAENFKLAAGSCDVEGGKVGDEHGHFYCTLQAKVEAQAAEIERLNKSAECLAETRRLAVKDLAVLEGHMRLEIGQWKVDYDCAIRDIEHLRERIEAQAAEIERLREALRPFAIAGEKGRAVYIGVAMAMKEKPELFPYSTAYVDAGRTTAASHLTWNDYDEARITLIEPEAGQPWLRTYDAHLKGTNNAE